MKFKTITTEVLIPMLALTVVTAALLGGCSQPILEPEECIAARDKLKRIYSFHFGNDLQPSSENLQRRADFVSAELYQKLKTQSDEKTDYFTQTADYPKAFRVGKCESPGSGRVRFEVLLFWKTPDRSEQREIEVEMIKEKSVWVVDRVTKKDR